MRIFIGTNILISCIVWPESKPSRAFIKAAYDCGNKAIISEHSLEELHRVFIRKFPGYVQSMADFLAKHFHVLEIVPFLTETYEAEQLIRDENDRPILRAAIFAGADILLTGDKDFLESGITSPRIMNASEFLDIT